jgi:hypothetical protein
MGDLQLVNRLHEPNHTLNAVPKPGQFFRYANTTRAFTPVFDGLWWRARCPYRPDGGYGLPARRLTALRNDMHMTEYPNSALPVII